MKKNFKKTMAAVMAAALTLSLAGTAAEADAAKKAKFASKSVTVNVGKTKTVKIKNVKANKVKKLTVKSKSKKIATVSKKGKTAVKVKGKKKGTTKVTATLKIKGQKKATKLTLTVKVKKPTPSTVTPAPVVPTAAVTAAPPAPSAPAVTNAPSTGAPATGVPATTTPAGPTKVPTEKPTAKPPWTPAPDVRVQDVSIKYDYEFPGTRVVKFDGTVVNHDNAEDTETYENAKAEGYPKDGIDVRYYKKVIVKYEGKKLTGDGDWFGKATLSSTDEGLGQNEYADGLFLKYLNDVDTAGGYKDGVYTVEYDIDESKLVDGFDFEDVGLVDCFSVQLAAEDDYAGFKLLSADFIAPEYPVETADPNATADPNTPTVTVKLGKAKVAQGETTSVELVVPEGTEIVSQTWSVEKADIAEVKDNVVTAKAVGDTKISVKAVVKSAGKDYNVEASATLSVKPAGSFIVNVELENVPTVMAVNETAMVSVAVDTGTIETVTWKTDGDAVTVKPVDGDSTKAVITATKTGTATVTAIVKLKEAEETEEVSASIAVDYLINKEVEIDNPKTAVDTAYYPITLDSPIKIKKTDIVEVVYSVKSGTADNLVNTNDKMVVELSTEVLSAAWNMHQKAILSSEASESSVAGKAVLQVNSENFVHNYENVNVILLHMPEKINAEKAVVRVEKINITPTDKLAFSLVQKPGGLEENVGAELVAEVDEGYTLEWTSEDTTTATVVKDSSDQTKAIVTGIKAGGTAKVKIDAKDSTGKVVDTIKAEFPINSNYKNKPITMDLSKAVGAWGATGFTASATGITIEEEMAGVGFSLDYKLAPGEKISVVVEGTFSDKATKGFRVYAGPSVGDGGVVDSQKGVFVGATAGDFAKGDFVSAPIELEASKECTHLTLRTPSHVTVTKVTITYL